MRLNITLFLIKVMQNQYRLSILCLALFSSQLVISQQEKNILKDSTKVEILEEVIISATRTKRQLSSLPLPVQLVHRLNYGSRFWWWRRHTITRFRQSIHFDFN
jgi:sulfate adenylyltransferase subunit 1 (EFTu-like GTPase family)